MKNDNISPVAKKFYLKHQTLVYVLIRWNCGGGGQEPLFKKLLSFIVESIELNVISGTPKDGETIEDESSCWASFDFS